MEGQKASGALTGPSVCSSTSFHDYDTRRKHRPFFRSYIRRVQSLQFPGELGPHTSSRLHARRRWRAVEPTHQHDNTRLACQADNPCTYLQHSAAAACAVTLAFASDALTMLCCPCRRADAGHRAMAPFAITRQFAPSKFLVDTS
jgi:hypothetical protein